jgi:hypothetical protein
LKLTDEQEKRGRALTRNTKDTALVEKKMKDWRKTIWKSNKQQQEYRKG